MVCAEFASAFAFSRTAVDQFISGWSEIVLRDSSHPSIEANGLCWPDRSPKIPVDRIRAFVNPTARLDEQIRPRTIREVSTQEEA